MLDDFPKESAVNLPIHPSTHPPIHCLYPGTLFARLSLLEGRTTWSLGILIQGAG
ncbi:MAG: hypothetical protein QNJ46_09825 [Leptolyngbyaceae cyanobacterium MO_188.B28]|nr:hypothetical protein [Leptolyngbyaceae cyanobacterium MO_188.B28]